MNRVWVFVLCLGFVMRDTWCLATTPRGRLALQSGATLESDVFPKASERLPSPRSLLDRVTFGWGEGLLRKGNEQILELEDLWLLPDEQRMAATSTTFDKLHADAMNAKSESEHDSVARTATHILSEFTEAPLVSSLLSMYKQPLVVSGLCKLVNTLVQFLPSLLVARILTTTDAMTTTVSPLLVNSLRKQGVALSLTLFAVLGLKTFFENQYFYIVTNTGTNIRGTLAAAIYKKAMRLTSGGRGKSSLGEIVNYMQLDASRMEAVATSVHILWDGLLQITGYTSLLLYFLGPSVFAGIAVLFAIIPLNAYFYKKLSAKRAEMLRYTDQRVKLTNEVLQGIRAIKSFNWERSYEAALQDLRAKELRSLREGANYRAILVSLMSAAPSIVAVITLAVYAFLGNVLSPARVFTALALFTQLRFPLIFYPMVINTYAEGKISLARLTAFFNEVEVKDYVERTSAPLLESKGGSGSARTISVDISDASFAWTPDTDDDEDGRSCRGNLAGIDLKIGTGELVAVVGTVGSGKSTLLSAILGELYKKEGSVKVAGSVAYVPQQAWIPNETLRDVILFGKPFRRGRYDDVLRSCGLAQDLAVLEAGDATEIGEKGINLSGGQKQRVSIARAVYDDADVYLFDDPLSALDSSVGVSVFQDCILGQLFDKTRIIVTNQMQVLPYVDKIVVMGKDAEGQGRVVDQGTLAELTSRGHDLSKLTVENTMSEIPEEAEEAMEDQEVHVKGAQPHAQTHTLSSSKGTSAPQTPPAVELDTATVPSSPSAAPTSIPDVATTKPFTEDPHTADTPPAQAEVEGGKLVAAEERAEGAVGWPVYRRYLRAVGKRTLMVVALASFVLANFTNIFQQWVVAAWTNDVGYVRRPLGVYLFSMSCMAMGVAGFNWARAYLGCLLGASASERLHSDMVRRVLSAPLSFFDATPTGRLIQRFSKDLDSVDQMLPQSFGQVVSSSLNILSAILAMSFVTPTFALVMVPVLVFYFSITNYYRPVARELKRLDSLSRSPIYAHFSESLSGLPVLRSFKKQPLFEAANQAKVDDNLSSFFALKTMDRWLSVRLEYMGNVIVLASSLLVVLTGRRSGPAGISLNNALSITSLLNWAVRNAADTENLMNSAERIFYTSSETPQERNFDLSRPKFSNPAEATDLTGTSLDGWPWRGGLELRNVRMRYREDFDTVLRDVSISVSPGQSVGVVGRTGSGKSSIFRAILRLTEVESGSILIDGEDISRLDMERLRSSVAVITQDPVLFSGSIRSSLDPFGEHDDATLLSALRDVNLGPTVAALPGGLDFVVKEGGTNFSVGQRQLICLARALVRRPKLLLLDEATSSIDYQTDAIIQRTIRTAFGDSGCTVITIAHRLRTVMDADKIVVMDAGSVAEVGSPSELLSNSAGMFTALVAAEAREDVGEAGVSRAGARGGGAAQARDHVSAYHPA